jgi:signal transduction histidine kinase
LFNLVGNAIKFTSSGLIHIEVATIPKSIKPMTKSIAQSKPNTIDLCFIISDSGIGIKPDQIAHIFKQFTQQEGQSAREFGGTGLGLGLAICTNLCAVMGGHITVISEVDKGSVFTVILNKCACHIFDRQKRRRQHRRRL